MSGDLKEVARLCMYEEQVWGVPSGQEEGKVSRNSQGPRQGDITKELVDKVRRKNNSDVMGLIQVSLQLAILHHIAQAVGSAEPQALSQIYNQKPCYLKSPGGYRYGGLKESDLEVS